MLHRDAVKIFRDLNGNNKKKNPFWQHLATAWGEKKCSFFWVDNSISYPDLQLIWELDVAQTL